MDLIEIIVFEFLLGYVLQGFSIVLGIYVFNKQKIIFKSYLFTSLIIIIISYLVRLLPISFGVHTLLNILILFLICTIVLKMPSFITIRSAFLVTVLLLISEMANVAVMLQFLGKEKFESMMTIPLEKAKVGFPGAAFFAFILLLLYFIMINQIDKAEAGDTDGSIGA